MGLLQESKAIFYHPLENSTESLKGQSWTESTTTFVSGKVSTALGPTETSDITFGVEAEFLVGTASNISIAGLSETKFVVAYRDQSDANHGTAKIGSVSVLGITFGTEAEFRGTAAQWTSVTRLSATTFVVAYRDEVTSAGTAKLGTVSGTNITFGAQAEFHGSSSISYTSATALTSTTFVVAYRDNGTGDGKANVGTVSGTSITFGATATFLSSSAFELSASALVSAPGTLDATKFVVVYRDVSASSSGTARVGTVSGTDITFGAANQYRTGNGAFFNSVSALAATKFVVGYRDFPVSHGKVKIGTVSGTDITFGPETEFQSTGGGAFDISVVALNAKTFVAAYRDNGDVNHGTIRVGQVSGVTATFGSETEFLNADGATFIAAARLNVFDFAVAYQDGDDASHGTAKAGVLFSGASVTASMPAAYDSAVGAEKITFAGWFKKPSVQS